MFSLHVHVRNVRVHNVHINMTVNGVLPSHRLYIVAVYYKTSSFYPARVCASGVKQSVLSVCRRRRRRRRLSYKNF